MDHLTIGDASVVRIEEMVDSTFLAANFFMPFDPEALQPHLHWLAPRYYVPDRGAHRCRSRGPVVRQHVLWSVTRCPSVAASILVPTCGSVGPAW